LTVLRWVPCLRALRALPWTLPAGPTRPLPPWAVLQLQPHILPHSLPHIMCSVLTLPCPFTAASTPPYTLPGWTTYRVANLTGPTYLAEPFPVTGLRCPLHFLITFRRSIYSRDALISHPTALYRPCHLCRVPLLPTLYLCLPHTHLPHGRGLAFMYTYP